MTQSTFTKPERYILCPACKKEDFRVCHLPTGTKTKWVCDECGVHFRVHVISADEVNTEIVEEVRTEKTLVTLRSEGPVTLVVEGLRHTSAKIPEDVDEFDRQERYYYDEHTCPTNYLSCVRKVIDEDGDEDPHGIFKYVKTEPWVKSKDA